MELADTAGNIVPVTKKKKLLPLLYSGYQQMVIIIFFNSASAVTVTLNTGLSQTLNVLL
jgi:hypothetical protein